MRAGLLAIVLLLAAAPAVAARDTGSATWYCSDGRDGSSVSPCPPGVSPSDLVAAIDRKDSPFRRGDLVRVTGPRGSVVVRIVDVCGCAGRRVIDLTIGAFERVAGDWRPGVVDVRLEPASGSPAPRATLPPTDTEPTFLDLIVALLALLRELR